MYKIESAVEKLLGLLKAAESDVHFSHMRNSDVFGFGLHPIEEVILDLLDVPADEDLDGDQGFCRDAYYDAILLVAEGKLSIIGFISQVKQQNDLVNHAKMLESKMSKDQIVAFQKACMHLTYDENGFPKFNKSDLDARARF